MKNASEQVAEVFKGYPPNFRRKLKDLRKIILKVAKSLPETEGIEETLKWGEPSYLPRKQRIGTTVRIHWSSANPDQYGLFFNCNTTLISSFKKKYGRLFRYAGKRAIVFKADDKVPIEELEGCIAMALTYHLQKRKTARLRK